MKIWQGICIFLVLILIVVSCGEDREQRIQRWIKNLGTDIPNIDMDARSSIKENLVKEGGTAKPYLLDALKNSDDESIRSNVGWVLAQMGVEEAVEPIRTMLFTSKNDEFRAEAAKNLAVLKKAAALPDLIKCLREDKAANVRLAIHDAMTDKTNKNFVVAAREQLLPLLRESDADIRTEAREIISRMGPDSIPSLLDLLSTVTANDKTLIWEIFKALVQIHDPSVQPQMKEAMNRFPEWKWKDKERGITTEFYKKLEDFYNKF